VWHRSAESASALDSLKASHLDSILPNDEGRYREHLVVDPLLRVVPYVDYANFHRLAVGGVGHPTLHDVARLTSLGYEQQQLGGGFWFPGRYNGEHFLSLLVVDAILS